MKICLLALALSLAQAPQTRPTFEVATIKRNTSASEAARFSGQTGRVTITNNPLRNIIRNAWGLQGFQIVGGPSLFTAIQEQLGLKLDAQRGPVDLLVTDSVGRPTED